jgi:hypothetical protein
MLTFMFGLPIVCAVAWVVLLVRGPRKGLLMALLMCEDDDRHRVLPRSTFRVE